MNEFYKYFIYCREFGVMLPLNADEHNVQFLQQFYDKFIEMTEKFDKFKNSSN